MTMQLFWNYIRENWVDLLSLTYDHILMVFIGIFLHLSSAFLLGCLRQEEKGWHRLL